MLGVNASGTVGQAIGQNLQVQLASSKQKWVVLFQQRSLTKEALTEDPSMELRNEELDIIDRLVAVKDGYEFGEGDNERGQLHQPAEVKGNLRRNLNFWIFGAPKFILSVIANGYCLLFQCTPVCVGLNNNKSALKCPQTNIRAYFQS